METAPRPRRGAPRKDEVGARERILATASELFYREGIRAIGVDTVVERSGVSKTSLYRLFESKDALIAAFAAEQDRLYWAWWDRLEALHADDPRALLDALLSGIAKRIGQTSFRGCPFLNLLTEFPDHRHPGRIVACANKKEMKRRLSALLDRIGVGSAEQIAAQLALMINGAYVTGALARPVDLRDDLIGAAAKLLAGRYPPFEADAGSICDPASAAASSSP